MTRFGWRPLLICLSAACGGSGQGSQPGRIEVRWTGSDSGVVSALATAEWCGDSRSLEIRAVQGDTGLALLLYPVDTIEADTYRVVQPEGADTLAPSAAVALRWFSLNAIKGFQGDTGRVVLEGSAADRLSGTLNAGARSVANSEHLSLSGRFVGLAVVPQSRGCGPEPAADSAPPQ